jgi:lauroyl/myristoyl acyltransferase
MRVLRKNGILSVTAGDWEGQRLATVQLCGGTLDLAVGAPRLARISGATLLPVFTVRGKDEDTIRVIIGPALPVPQRGDADDALQNAARGFARALEHYVRGYPAEWREWKKLRLAPDDQ